MNLEALILIPMAGGALACLAGLRSAVWARWVSLVSLAAALGVALSWWGAAPLTGDGLPGGGRWVALSARPWIPEFGISLFLGIDGLSLLLVLLTLFLGVLAVAVSWREIGERVGFFHFNLLWTITGLLGVFLSLDLFLFFFFWELMIVPMYFLIGIWGHENRHDAAVKFFLFTQASGLLMLTAIIGLHVAYARQTGIATFSYPELLNAALPGPTGRWLMLGFFVAFAVKLPAVPLHTWLADAHTEAPTAGSLLLAGVLLKTGAYGLLRFVLPLFPDAAAEFAPWAMALGVAGILYGAKLAFAQRDLKRLIAYTSVSHMGFVLLGAFAWNTVAVHGVVVQMLAHGISTGALFILAGGLYERLHTRDMDRMGGLWSRVPRLAGVGLFFALASLGLPGLGNFVGEFLVLLGSFAVSPAAAVGAAAGLVLATVYALWIVQRVFHGAVRAERSPADLSWRETAVFAALIAAIVWLGLYPAPFLRTAGPSVEVLLRAEAPRAAEPLASAPPDRLP